MTLAFAIFTICLMGWGGSLYLMRQTRTLNRLFLFLVMSIWTYVSFAIWIISLDPPLWTWLLLGLIPVFAVAYGYRYYEAKQKLAENAPQQIAKDAKTRTHVTDK